MMDILLVCIGLLVLWYIPIILYIRLGFFKWWYHGVLKWHRPDKSKQWKEGFFMHSFCKICGEEITRDSQGNWLSDDEW